MDLSIIIVSWNVRDLLQKCLESIYKFTRGVTFEIFVIDNASADAVVDMVRSNFPGVRLTANKTNLGFSAANNQGIKQSSGDYVLLLNPDTELIEDSFTKMINFARTKPDAGIIGPRLLNVDRRVQPSVRRLPEIWDQLWILLKLHRVWPKFPSYQRYLGSDIRTDASCPVPQVMGACFLIKKIVLDEIGLLDEKFFIWFEEVDFCRRAAAAGFATWFYADTSVIHHYAQSFNQLMSYSKQKMWNRSLTYYFKKHHAPWKLHLIKLGALLALGQSKIIEIRKRFI